MSDQVIVDTDVLIDVGRGVQDAVACLLEVEQHGPLATSVVSQMELIIGCRNKAELQTVEQFLSRFQIITLDESVCDTAVNLLRVYRMSHGLLIADALIAATALALNRPLVTKNQRDYRFIQGLQLLPYPHPFAP